MKFNEKQLADTGRGPAEIEGRLNHKRGHKSGTLISKINVRFSFTGYKQVDNNKHNLKMFRTNFEQILRFLVLLFFLWN